MLVMMWCRRAVVAASFGSDVFLVCCCCFCVGEESLVLACCNILPGSEETDLRLLVLGFAGRGVELCVGEGITTLLLGGALCCVVVAGVTAEG